MYAAKKPPKTILRPKPDFPQASGAKPFLSRTGVFSTIRSYLFNRAGIFCSRART
jgi:hypothetical protein